MSDNFDKSTYLIKTVVEQSSSALGTFVRAWLIVEALIGFAFAMCGPVGAPIGDVVLVGVFFMVIMAIPAAVVVAIAWIAIRL